MDLVNIHVERGHQGWLNPLLVDQTDVREAIGRCYICNLIILSGICKPGLRELRKAVRIISVAFAALIIRNALGHGRPLVVLLLG